MPTGLTAQGCFGERGNEWLQITLSTANTHSHDKKRVTLQTYVDRHMEPQKENITGRDTLYHFGGAPSFGSLTWFCKLIFMCLCPFEKLVGIRRPSCSLVFPVGRWVNLQLNHATLDLRLSRVCGTLVEAICWETRLLKTGFDKPYIIE